MILTQTVWPDDPTASKLTTRLWRELPRRRAFARRDPADRHIPGALGNVDDGDERSRDAVCVGTSEARPRTRPVAKRRGASGGFVAAQPKRQTLRTIDFDQYAGSGRRSLVVEYARWPLTSSRGPEAWSAMHTVLRSGAAGGAGGVPRRSPRQARSARGDSRLVDCTGGRQGVAPSAGCRGRRSRSGT
jgi:hypothetical protein